MYLVVDCETTGKPRDWNARLDCLANWPHAVQIAWCLYDSMHQPMGQSAYLIRPEGFRIPPDAQAIHGISNDRALSEGLPISDVLGELSQAASQASVVISHNARFDGSVLAVEYLRLRQKPPFYPADMICTMTESTDYCRIPGPYGNKWPRLEELYWILFHERFEGAHDASVDVAACARCYFELKNRGVIPTL